MFEETNTSASIGGVIYRMGGTRKELGSRKSNKHCFYIWFVLKDQNGTMWCSGCPLQNGSYVVVMYRISTLDANSSENPLRVLCYQPASDSYSSALLAECKQGDGSCIELNAGGDKAKAKRRVDAWRTFLREHHGDRVKAVVRRLPSKRSCKQTVMWSPDSSGSGSRKRNTTAKQKKKKRNTPVCSPIPMPSLDSETESDVDHGKGECIFVKTYRFLFMFNCSCCSLEAGAYSQRERGSRSGTRGRYQLQSTCCRSALSGCDVTFR